MSIPHLTLALLVGLSLSVGCAAPPLSTATFSGTGTGSRQEQQGLEVEAEIVADKAQLKELFGVEDSLGKDTVAVYVQVRNLRKGKTIIVQPQNFRLVSGETSDSRVGRDTGQKVAEAAAVVTIGTVVGPIVLAPVAIAVVLAGASSQAHITVVRNNVARRELKSATLQTGESANGFLYFQLPEGPASAGLRLGMSLLEAGTTSSETIELNLAR